MESLNEIEKQLKERSLKEIEEVINNFLNDIETLSNKYNSGGMFFSFVDKNYSKGTSCLEKSGVRHHLRYMLREKYLNNMVKYKSKELLSKLDLLS